MSEPLLLDDCALHECTMPPSCGGTFTCNACERSVGWCLGCDDDMPALCNDCWRKYDASEKSDG